MKKQKTTEKIFIDKNSLYKLSFIIITFFWKKLKKKSQLIFLTVILIFLQKNKKIYFLKFLFKIIYLTIWNKIATTRNNVATISVNFSIPSFSSSKIFAELFAKPWLLSGCSKITLIIMIDKITKATINKFSNTLLVPPII